MSKDLDVDDLYEMIEEVVVVAEKISNGIVGDARYFSPRTTEDYYDALSEIDEDFLPELKKLVQDIKGSLHKF